MPKAKEARTAEPLTISLKAATEWFGVRLTGKIPTDTTSGDISRAFLQGLVKGNSFSWEEGSSGKDRLKAQQILGLLWAQDPWPWIVLDAASTGLAPCCLTSPKVLPSAKWESCLWVSQRLCAFCLTSGRVKRQILIASDSPHPTTPCSRVRHSGGRTRDDGGGCRSRHLKSSP